MTKRSFFAIIFVNIYSIAIIFTYMKVFFEPNTLQAFHQRIDSLTPESQRQWGKMSVAQMVAHMNKHMELVIGDVEFKSNPLIRFMGNVFFKHLIYGKKPWRKNMPTSPALLMVDEKEFATEKQRMIALFERLVAGGLQGVTSNQHPFFGKLTKEEWASGFYVHFDHHLKQFNV